MTVSSLWAALIVVTGLLSGMLYFYLTVQARVGGLRALIGLMLSAVCLYPAIVWGGQILGLWVVTPELGRPALFLTLGGLGWIAMAAYGGRRRGP